MLCSTRIVFSVKCNKDFLEDDVSLLVPIDLLLRYYKEQSMDYNF